MHLLSELRRIREAHLPDPIVLSRREHFGNKVVLHAAVSAQVDFRLRLPLSLRPQVAFELLHVRDWRAVPHDGAVEVNIQIDNLWLFLILRGRLRKIQFHCVGHDRKGNDQCDEQHEHDIDERSRIDLTHGAVTRNKGHAVGQERDWVMLRSTPTSQREIKAPQPPTLLRQDRQPFLLQPLGKSARGATSGALYQSNNNAIGAGGQACGGTQDKDLGQSVQARTPRPKLNPCEDFGSARH